MMAKIVNWFKNAEAWKVFVTTLLIAEIPAVLIVGSYYYFSQQVILGFPAIIALIVAAGMGLIIVLFVFKLRESEAAKNEFISIAAHQLRGPISSMQWTIELFLNKEKIDEKTKVELESIQHSLKHFNDLLDLLLNVNRLEGGNLNISSKPINVNELISDYIIEEQPVAEKKGLALEFKDSTKPIVTTTDIAAVINIIHSLISNAIDYTPTGGHIKVSLEKTNSNLLFSVSDTGIGIPHDEQAKIFQKFYRASNVTSIKAQGTGLGLYIAYRATELLGGRIWFESQENKGTIFYVELPLEHGAR